MLKDRAKNESLNANEDLKKEVLVLRVKLIFVHNKSVKSIICNTFNRDVTKKIKQKNPII